MTLDPDRLTGLNEKFETLTRRFDAFIERRRANAEGDPEDEDEDDLLEPAEQAMRATPGSELANPGMNDPWFK
jgi:hypothetical protein